VNKPDWKDAPEWANYLAMDRNGAWCWHEAYVMPQYAMWLSRVHGRVQIASQPGDEWRETLEERQHA
jgi:hypothetical protein